MHNNPKETNHGQLRVEIMYTILYSFADTDTDAE